ncbi:hypothetical protein V2A60_000277 [Cordyceps javanica]
MRTFALTTMGVAVQAIAVANNLATVDDNRAVELPGMLRFPVEGSRVPQHRGAAVRRQAPSDLLNQQEGTQYLISLSMGNPGQDVKVAFDTGSNELWVNPDCSTSGNAESEKFCRSLGRFVPGKSTVDLGQKGGVTYGKGQVKFDYVRDSVGLGSARIANQTFGAAYASNDLGEGIMGAGPDLRGFDAAPYPMVVDSLAQQGIINARAFSVDLRSVDNPRGAVIFGGADTKKFKGTLSKRPIVVPGPDGNVRYWISMDGLTVNRPDGTTQEGLAPGASLPVFPDTGATLGHLPKGLVDAVAAGFPGARFDPARNQHTVPCSLRKVDKTVDFKFGDALIKVPFNDFIWQAGTDLCVLGVAPSPANSKTWSLGDSFLRAAYAVFDQDNKNVWLAQSADCGTNLVAFGKGANAVEALQGDCGKPPVTSSSTTTTTTSTATTSSQTSSAPTTTTTSSSSSSSMTSSSSSQTSSVSNSTSSVPTGTGIPTSSIPTGTSIPTSSIPTGTGVPTSSIPTGTGVPTSSVPTGTGIPTSSVPTGTGLPTTGSGLPTGTGSSTSTPWSNVTTTAAPTYTSTFLTTTTYTITSCPPVVTNCPVGRVTTEVITSYTTWCPGEQTATRVPPQPTGQPKCPGPECGQPGKPEQPGKPDNICPGPHCYTDKPTAPGETKPTGPAGGNQCPGPNCNKPTASVPGENKPTGPAGGHQCPGGPNCPAQTTSTGSKPSAPAGGHQCPGGANCPHPTGGMTTTVSKPCATCGSVGPTGKPTSPPVVTGAAAGAFRVSGTAAIAAAIAALVL